MILQPDRAGAADGVPGIDHPGRWLGGLLGSLACLPPLLIGLALNGWGFSKPAGFNALWDSIATFSALGIPIGWVLGRQLWPAVRSHGLQHALGVGLLFGWAAPILGALEICLGGLLLPDADPPLLLGTSGVWILPIAIPVSFLAAPLTLSVGVFWAVLSRLIPSSLQARTRMPAPIDRMGTRHILIALVTWVIVAVARTS